MPVRDDIMMYPEDLEGWCTSTPLLSDDIWKKFELLDLPLNEFAAAAEPCDVDEWSEVMLERDEYTIRRHDCMWAGRCGSKEHRADEAACAATPLKKPLRHHHQPQLQVQRHCQHPPPQQTPHYTVMVSPGRSVLRRPLGAPQPSPVVTLIRPDSPPVSDDDDADDEHFKFKREASLADAVNRIANGDDYADDEDAAIRHLVISEDYSDESEEDEDAASSMGDYKETELPPQPQTDHCYHKESFCVDNLGVQTPSDSENEEVDVVSVDAKQAAVRSGGAALPTNPSLRDRQKLQQTVASAIISNGGRPGRSSGSNSNSNSGSSSPASSALSSASSSSSSSSGGSTPVKRRAESTKSSRPVKRSRASGSSRHKQRASAHASRRRHSSDSEPEMSSDKRNLHNNMERQRRVDLRNAFDDLRVLVPEVSGKERAAKVVILREAAAYCDHLGDESEAMTRQVAEMRRYQARLRTQLAQLRRSLAAQR